MQITRNEARRHELSRKLDWGRFVGNIQPILVDRLAYYRLKNLFTILVTELIKSKKTMRQHLRPRGGGDIINLAMIKNSQRHP